MIDPLRLFWLVLRATLVSTGGTGNVPILFDDLLAAGFATERHFAEALAIGQVTPGPTGLWVVSLGYLIAGVPGGLAAAAAVTLPPLLILPVERMYRRTGTHWAVQGFLRGLGLAVAGSFLIVIVGLARSTRFDLGALLIAAASIALGASRRVPVPLVIALAAVAGMVLYG